MNPQCPDPNCKDGSIYTGVSLGSRKVMKDCPNPVHATPAAEPTPILSGNPSKWPAQPEPTAESAETFEQLLTRYLQEIGYPLAHQDWGTRLINAHKSELATAKAEGRRELQDKILIRLGYHRDTMSAESVKAFQELAKGDTPDEA